MILVMKDISEESIHGNIFFYTIGVISTIDTELYSRNEQESNQDFHSVSTAAPRVKQRHIWISKKKTEYDNLDYSRITQSMNGKML